MLLVFLRSRTSWSKLLIWDLPHRPVSCCVSVLQCLGRAGKRRKARGNHKRWKHVFKLNVFKHKRKHNENEEIHSDISSVGTDPGKHYFTWITLAYHCSLRLPMGCRTDNTFSSSLSSVFRHVFDFYNVSILHIAYHFDLHFMHCWSSLRILFEICIEADLWFYRSTARLDSTVIYDGCDPGDSRIRPDQCASCRPEESAGTHFGSGHSHTLTRF